MDINETAVQIYENNVLLGWRGADAAPRSFVEEMMLVVTEVVEAAEEWRKAGPGSEGHVYYKITLHQHPNQLRADKVRSFEKPDGSFGILIDQWNASSEAWETWEPTNEELATMGYAKPEGAPIEIADAIIRLLDTAHHYFPGELEKWLRLKMEYNKTREYRHGGKFL